jgi:hypothetical protein
MQCLRHEITIRKKQTLPAPEIKVVDYSTNPTHTDTVHVCMYKVIDLKINKSLL